MWLNVNDTTGILKQSMSLNFYVLRILNYNMQSFVNPDISITWLSPRQQTKIQSLFFIRTEEDSLEAVWNFSPNLINDHSTGHLFGGKTFFIKFCGKHEADSKQLWKISLHLHMCKPPRRVVQWARSICQATPYTRLQTSTHSRKDCWEFSTKLYQKFFKYSYYDIAQRIIKLPHHS